MQQIKDVVQDHRSFLGSIQKEEIQYDPFLISPNWHGKIQLQLAKTLLVMIDVGYGQKQLQ
jgi:hypothetical protein